MVTKLKAQIIAKPRRRTGETVNPKHAEGHERIAKQNLQGLHWNYQVENLEELRSQARRRLAREGIKQTIGSGSSRISRRIEDIVEEDSAPISICENLKIYV